MTLRQYLMFLGFGTAVALAAVCIVLFGIDPATAGAGALIAFYITLGAAMIGVLTIVGTSIRVARHKEEDVGHAVARSLRQGVFLSALLLISLYLSSRGMLTMLTAILLILLVTLVEFFFLASKKEHSA